MGVFCACILCVLCCVYVYVCCVVLCCVMLCMCCIHGVYVLRKLFLQEMLSTHPGC